MALVNGLNGKKHDPVPCSRRSKDTFNPIRNIVDTMKIESNVEKKFISLSIGDPTIFGNLPVSEATNEALIENIELGKCHGYLPAQGSIPAREAVASHFSSANHKLTIDDVYLTSGCSGAIDLAIGVLAEKGSTILVPRPGFSIYQTLSTVYNVNVRHYNLSPSNNWEVDLYDLEKKVDSSVSCLVVCNPSNPCGSVWSLKHMCEILQIAARHHLPIISDEVYADMTFSNAKFYSFGQISNGVPVLVTGGLAKRWLVPGWRVGWVLVYDSLHLFSQVKKGLTNLSQRILGPNSICQAAIPKILTKTSEEFYLKTISHIEENATYAFSALSEINGLKPVMPAGAMYMMVGIDRKVLPSMDDVQFTQQLVSQQSVFCLPGKCFQYPDYFRIVLTLPREQLEEACSRVKQFCDSCVELPNDLTKNE